MFLQSFSVSFNPTLRYFLSIFLLLNFHIDTILPQACINWGIIFYSSIYTKHLEYKWKALSHMPMHTFSCLTPRPSQTPFSLKAQISGPCWWPLSLQLCVTRRLPVLPGQSPLDWHWTPSHLRENQAPAPNSSMRLQVKNQTSHFSPKAIVLQLLKLSSEKHRVFLFPNWPTICLTFKFLCKMTQIGFHTSFSDI